MKSLIIFFAFGLLILGCKEDEIDLPEYFNYTFKDNISFNVYSDSIYLFLEQTRNNIKFLDSVPIQS